MASDDLEGPRVLIRLSADESLLAGSVRVNEGPERVFSGWLELMRELEGAHDGTGQPVDERP